MVNDNQDTFLDTPNLGVDRGNVSQSINTQEFCNLEVDKILLRIISMCARSGLVFHSIFGRALAGR
jgi:hypothetical protein